MEIRRATPEDKVMVTELALRLWPDNTFAMLLLEINEIISDEEAVIILVLENEQAVAFAQGQLRRDYVEGTNTSPVGYLEGVFVEETYRRHGLAKELLSLVEDWAREKGCREFASDVPVDNTESLEFHRNNGFREAATIVCFTKDLVTKEESQKESANDNIIE